MLGLDRMDSDILAANSGTAAAPIYDSGSVDRSGNLKPPEPAEGQTSHVPPRRLIPATLHPLPKDPLLLEEGRRTMWVVFVIDCWESSAIGWSHALPETNLRLLLPCHDSLFEGQARFSQGTDLGNVECWPRGLSATELLKGARDGVEGIQSPFVWLIRSCLLCKRITQFHYRSDGLPLGGPLAPADPTQQKQALTDHDMNELDTALAWIERGQSQSQQSLGVRSSHPLVAFAHLAIKGMVINLHYLRTNSMVPIRLLGKRAEHRASPLYSTQRALSAVINIHQLVQEMAAQDNATINIRQTRITPFTGLIPYVLLVLGFPPRLLIGEWGALGICKTRSSGLSGGGLVVRSLPDPTPDELGPDAAQFQEQKLMAANEIVGAMKRIWTRFPVAGRFVALTEDAIRSYDTLRRAQAAGSQVHADHSLQSQMHSQQQPVPPLAGFFGFTM